MNRQIFTENEFAHLGEGEVAYVRKIRSDDLARSFPALPTDRAGPGTLGAVWRQR